MPNKMSDKSATKSDKLARKSAKKPSEPKRFRRIAPLGEALGRGLDPVFKKRGFASQDIVRQWPSIAPKPYDEVSLPDKLMWPRKEAGSEGAILFVRCAEAHRLAFSYETDRLAAAINRYFGYVLVQKVKLSSAPFSPHSDAPTHIERELAPETIENIEQAVKDVKDEGLQQALRQLGKNLMQKEQ